MEQTNGYLAAINALGEKINAMEDELKFAHYRVENLEAELKQCSDSLTNAHALIEAKEKKLEAVHNYIERMEEA